MSVGEAKGTRKSLICFGGGRGGVIDLFRAFFPIDNAISQIVYVLLHCKKKLVIFPSPVGMFMLLAKLSLAGNYKTIPGQEGFGYDIPAGGSE
jgi:hypothetical protein